MPGARFFPSPQGKHLDPDNFSQDLRDANQEAKLQWACLEYRHTFGSHGPDFRVDQLTQSLLQGGAEAIDVMQGWRGGARDRMWVLKRATYVSRSPGDGRAA